jgi:2,4-dienoyl-CoA reductase-like NADH-dependent reductase (Old Yellow Enzyme family)
VILDPLVFRNGARARNRAWLAPMTNQQSHPDGSLSDDELRWLDMRARGGFGVVETCAADVALDGQGWFRALRVYDDRLLPGLRRLAAALAGQGALGAVQLFSWWELDRPERGHGLELDESAARVKRFFDGAAGAPRRDARSPCVEDGVDHDAYHGGKSRRHRQTIRMIFAQVASATALRGRARPIAT